jgi:hypothetical protein
MNIKIILFSKDRAMQLDTVLRSFFLHCRDGEENAVICVIYKASNERHAQQYKELFRFYPQVQFSKQQNFYKDLLHNINPYQSGSPKSFLFNVLIGISSIGFPIGSFLDDIMRHFADRPRIKLLRMLLPRTEPITGVLFLVDDNIFVRNFYLVEIMSALQQNPQAIGFSLRLGRNTQYCYSLRRQQSLPEFKLVSHNILKYNWTRAELDFAYPLEISSSLYLTDMMIPLLMSMWFRNPNELEGKIAARSFIFQNEYPELMCYGQSVTFCNPINIVQSVSKNRVGEQVELSTDHLADLFAMGKRVNIRSFDGFIPNACHQEVDLKFNAGEE